MKLNLGSGARLFPGFINVDIRDIPGIDRREDVISLPSFETESADLIYACHVLEHFHRHDRKAALHRWLDVLKPGGTLRIAVPDFDKVICLLQTGVSLNRLIGFLYGGQDYEYNFHYYCWNFNSITEDLEEIGFSNIRRYDWRKTEHADIDDYSQSYWPHMQKETGLLMSLNVEATKNV